ncbi:MAG: lysophospholipid acyltransferase family protein [Pseudomonadota bacterium]
MTLRFVRRFGHVASLDAAVSWLIARYLRFVRRSGRWEIVGAEPRALAQSGRGRLILACWHGRLAMFPTERAGPIAIRAMISRNRDGEMVARIMDCFGIETIRGSSEDAGKPWRKRGGREAFVAALAALRRSADLRVAITPDGPRGPRMRCHPGVAMLSARTGVPVVPFTFSVRRGWELGSWDRFLLPAPFSRGVICWGEPLEPPRAADGDAVAAYCKRIETALNALMRAADVRTGRRSPEPG